MAKVGIVSIHDMTNVGNRLQQYGLVKALEQLGHEPVVIPNEPYDGLAAEHRRATADNRADNAPSPARRRRLRSLANKIANKLPQLSPNELERLAGKELRRRALTEFTQREMQIHTAGIFKPGDGELVALDFDKFVAGSDQNWNPKYRGACPTDFLQFADPSARIAYAASFGVEVIEEPRRSFIAKMASEIPWVSTREQTGAALFEELTGRNVPVVVDPTLLLTPEHWRRLADGGRALSKKPYVATYLLGRNEAETRAAISRAAKHQQLGVVDILAPKSLTPDAYSVETVLRTIRDAAVVVTDSFHMSLFALLFEKPLSTLSKSETNDRLMTLFDKFDVELQLTGSVPAVLPRTPAPSRMRELLPVERERGLQFLRDALSS